MRQFRSSIYAMLVGHVSLASPFTLRAELQDDSTL